MLKDLLIFITENKIWFELSSLIISGILIWFVIFIVVKTQLIGEKTKYFFDALGKTNLSKRRSVKAWKQIKKRFDIGDDSNLKLAIIEADKILDELLKISGYQGETMADRLKQLTTAQLSNINEIWEVHKLRNSIVHEPNFQISRGEAWNAIEIYKKAFKEFGLID